MKKIIEWFDGTFKDHVVNLVGNFKTNYLIAVLKRDLTQDIISDTSGDFQKALVALAKVCYAEAFWVIIAINKNQCSQDYFGETCNK